MKLKKEQSLLISRKQKNPFKKTFIFKLKTRCIILKKNEIIGIAALLIHAAKIDEIYSENEKNCKRFYSK